MKKSFDPLMCIICPLLFFTASSFGQDLRPDSLSVWKKKLIFNVNFNQASFSSNWKAGGMNSIGLNSAFNYKANYIKEPHSWDNEVDLLFGFVRNSGQGYRKTIDRIYLDSKYGYKLTSKWDLFTSMNFLSQFSKGYRYDADNQAFLISDIAAPAFVTSAWGVEYHPTNYFKLRLSPFAPRITIVNDPVRFTKTVGPEPYGVDSTKSVRIEWLAFQLLADLNKEISQNFNLKVRYMLFANYETLRPKAIDHRVDLTFNAKVNRHINVGISGILIYDYDQDSGAQVSQVFSIGFGYTFQNYAEK